MTTEMTNDVVCPIVMGFSSDGVNYLYNDGSHPVTPRCLESFYANYEFSHQATTLTF